MLLKPKAKRRLWARFARDAPPAWTTAHPSVASVPVGRRLRKEWANSCLQLTHIKKSILGKCEVTG
jgi:hypothetical protein